MASLGNIEMYKTIVRVQLTPAYNQEKMTAEELKTLEKYGIKVVIDKKLQGD